MKRILILGAGRSATSLINYLLEQADTYDWIVTVADMSLELALQKIGNSSRGNAVQLNAIQDVTRREALIQGADLVVSMLPPHLHVYPAKDCLRFNTNLTTASYVSPEVQALSTEAAEKGLTFLFEMGLDPGIDHMSAMQIIDHIRDLKGEIQSFKSYAGGLVAPESDNNPWHYKFSWSPRNVVLAGQGVAKYLYQNRYKHVNYSRLFAQSALVDVPGMGIYEAYPNRASLTYREAYGLDNIPTILRATLRHRGYCSAWNLLIQLGLTNDSYTMDYSEDMTYALWVESYLPPSNGKTWGSLKERLAEYFGLNVEDESLAKLEWLGLFEEKLIEKVDATPAQILQDLLEKKWKLEPEDKDMIIMQHEFEYTKEGKTYRHTSTLVQKGENASDTAMSRLVGVPLAIGAKHILLGNITNAGVHIPIKPEIYNPVMKELADYGVKFSSKDEEIN
ncbi:MAG: saccharopine dehydrogenase NADP-binding domain-containing protein [Saprospiraceae bacterium]|nr:saccharopine dehydrogenase NADP-binding domain-containing protein [Saprospiraceae bacterium]